MKAFIVVDLGFGDCGKGLLTDYLVRRHSASWVVRFNGGAQAGHNVVAPDGRHHTFSQLGAGSFVAGVRTHLSREVVVHPTALAIEAERMTTLGERDVLARVSVDPACRVTTPYHQASGRLRELTREGARHGSCGVGVGETVGDSLAAPALTVRFGELLRPIGLREKLNEIRQRKLREHESLLQTAQSEAISRELQLLQDPGVSERWLELASATARAVQMHDDSFLEKIEAPVVFEGAQGVLLDEAYGFHPFTTWSRCTPHVAARLLAEHCPNAETTSIGVLRAYALRHGPGPFPSEDSRVSELTSEPHNASGPWQGPVRKGWLDLMLLRYALQACEQIDALAVTHLDALPRLGQYRWCEAYEGAAALALPQTPDEQAQLTARVTVAVPQYTSLAKGPERASAERLCDALQERSSTPVRFSSTGPCARDVVERLPLPR